MEKKLEIYVHIPFCVRKCAYCDFLSGPADEKQRKIYVDDLCREIEACPEKVREYRVPTVFFGGGTPSILEGEQLAWIMSALRKRFEIAENAEISMEMNPGTVTEEKLAAFRRAGINRLSIGLQSVHEEELRMLGRIHTYEEFLESYRMARKAGFDNINIDLISAIPGQTAAGWEETLRTVTALEPEHISAYSLIIEPGTPFYERYGETDGEDRQEDAFPGLPDEDEEREMYWRTKEILRDAGYRRYEISNYSREGYECRHNLGYWDRVPYLGFGIGAASLVPAELREDRAGTARYSNPDQMEEYRRSFAGKFSGELLSREEEMEEFMFLGLRKMEGVSRRSFLETFQVPIEDVYGEPVGKLKREGLLEEETDRIFLTDRGIDVSNRVFVEFML